MGFAPHEFSASDCDIAEEAEELRDREAAPDCLVAGALEKRDVRRFASGPFLSGTAAASSIRRRSPDGKPSRFCSMPLAGAELAGFQEKGYEAGVPSGQLRRVEFESLRDLKRPRVGGTEQRQKECRVSAATCRRDRRPKSNHRHATMMRCLALGYSIRLQLLASLHLSRPDRDRERRALLRRGFAGSAKLRVRRLAPTISR
jgi:hypothetical protein